jgi:hypothetical protein
LASRAEDRKYHFTYKVTCTYNQRVFYGVHSADELDDSFTGKGTALNESKKDYGLDRHVIERIQIYPTRQLAKVAYNDLKASELINPIRSEDKTFHFLYKIKRFDGKYYIGIHSTNDLNDKYMGSGAYISRSLKKHGVDKHSRDILIQCKSRSRAYQCEAIAVTQDLIDSDPLCMNRTVGGKHHGDRVYGITEEGRRKKSEFFKNVERTEEWRSRISAAQKGKVISEEAKQKRLDTLKERGYKPTAETIEKQRIGQQNSEKFKQQYRPMIIDGIVYQNGREAVTALGIPGSTLAYRLTSQGWLNYRFLDAPEKTGHAGPRAHRGSYK